ncbi:ATP-dependent DNA/RNA helicase [Saxophila tyrrhenica]|uniref:RNA helicase n=1 Tax=Saxophila tyrrhenica TaxID=1690608 RepID=A0AAV9PFP1_9PEZI|nr:ATP-dependent DNA/RNA helicase [Saxophila tyrrhenica]
MKRKLNADDVPEAVADGTTDDAAPATPTFARFDLDARLLQAVSREKFSTPTLVQAKAIPVILNGKDVLARSKTGSGKTLAYLLPIHHGILQRKAISKAVKATTALILVPTKELAKQVTTTIKTLTSFCAHEIRCENITRKEDAAVTRARLAEQPDIVVSTPSRAGLWLKNEVLKLNSLKQLVIDEADLVLSYGYSSDLNDLSSSLPPGLQTILASATLNTEISTLTSLLSKTKTGPSSETLAPVVLDLSSEEAAEESKLSHYVVRSAEEDKFLLIYAIFKLKLIKGKVIVFVADIDRCYRVKLFLEQFGIRSCVLNSELPVNSRVHVVEEFNRGVYDIIIAADEGEVVGDGDGRSKKRRKTKQQREAADGDNKSEDDDILDDEQDIGISNTDATQEKSKKQQKNAEYTLSRGIDFRHVACVLNFDLPLSAKSYLHRVGRTARAGQTGMALSFYVPKELYRKHKSTTIEQCKNDEQVLGQVRDMFEGKAENGEENTKQIGSATNSLQEWKFDMAKLDAFRYRFADALRSVTRIAVREARTRELRDELMKSEKLKRHFEENPDDLRHLRHDNELTHSVRQRPHLRHVPEYLLPEGGRAAVAKDVRYVGLRKDSENKIRKARARNAGRGRSKLGGGRGGRAADPLRSLNVRGRGKNPYEPAAAILLQHRQGLPIILLRRNHQQRASLSHRCSDCAWSLSGPLSISGSLIEFVKLPLTTSICYNLPPSPVYVLVLCWKLDHHTVFNHIFWGLKHHFDFQSQHTNERTDRPNELTERTEPTTEQQRTNRPNERTERTGMANHDNPMTARINSSTRSDVPSLNTSGLGNIPSTRFKEQRHPARYSLAVSTTITSKVRLCG